MRLVTPVRLVGVLACIAFYTSNASASWDTPVTAPSNWFGGECPDGGWAEKHVLALFTPPNYCPKSLNDYRATHSHAPMHGMAFLDYNNVVYGIHDETGNVFGSSDIVLRKDPRDPDAKPNEDKGFVDAWIYRNPSGLIVRNPHDDLHYSEFPICMGAYDNALTISNEYKTTHHSDEKCALPAMRLTKEPAVANYYGRVPVTYVTWLEKDAPKVNEPKGTYQHAWKVYVAAIAQSELSGQQKKITYLTGGLGYGGALNRDGTKNAHSPKIAIVAGDPWVIWAEDDASGARVTYVRAYENGNWTDKGSYWGTGDRANCFTTITGPSSTANVKSVGYSVDIASVTTAWGARPVIVTANELAGECTLVVRMFFDGVWKQIGTAGSWNPGQASGLTNDGLLGAWTPRIAGTPSGDVFVVWQEGQSVRLSTAHVWSGPTAAWKDLASGSTSGTVGVPVHWGSGEFPSLSVTPYSSDLKNWWHMVTIASSVPMVGTRVDRTYVGTMANTVGYVQKSYKPTIGDVVGNVASVDYEGVNSSQTWYAPTNITPTKVGQTGAFDNYVTWIQRGDGHRTPDTGVFIRRAWW